MIPANAETLFHQLVKVQMMTLTRPMMPEKIVKAIHEIILFCTNVNITQNTIY